MREEFYNKKKPLKHKALYDWSKFRKEHNFIEIKILNILASLISIYFFEIVVRFRNYFNKNKIEREN
jgi:hypothetical protein